MSSQTQAIGWTPPLGEVRVTRVGTQVVVRLSGRIDAALQGPFVDAREEVMALRPRRVAVDLDGVSALDSSGVDFLHELEADCAQAALPFRLVQVPVDVRRCLHRSGAAR